jgi:hypothetical protein
MVVPCIDSTHRFPSPPGILAVRLEKDDYIIDVFDSAIESADDAHLTTHTCDTFRRR